MFKVICIKKFNGVNEYGIPVKDVQLPIVGKIYTVIGLNIDNNFILKEIIEYNEFGIRVGYDKYKFARIDETFATEVLEQIKEQIEQEELVTI